MNKVRVRFAPSPTGGLHLGGVRTALYNYLFAKQNNGDFILRIEDTDQTRYVEGAEQYIVDCLAWCGITPDEGPHHEGAYGPYRQSERKSIYRKYAEQLIDAGQAYYAFDTPEEIEAMREQLKSTGKDNLQYGHQSRLQMKNSLSISKEETEQLLRDNVPHVIRIKVQPDENVTFNDLIRGEISMSTNGVDDKVLLKADGMPTYHLAVVVDDYLMKITHAFRGEEWLPSAPVHVLLYQYLGWENEMPSWGHFPLILKPDGNGKLSKRDGERLGFPVFALEWNDPVKGNIEGFKELGFMPEAFLNMLAMLGWNDGTQQEIFSLKELVQKFSIERVQLHGAKFDFEKAKWYNQEWIKKSDSIRLGKDVRELFVSRGVLIKDENQFYKIIDLIKERCTLLSDFWEQGNFFFITPKVPDVSSIQSNWNGSKTEFFRELMGLWHKMENWDNALLESSFKELAIVKNIKPGELMLPFRIFLVGGKFGPGVFEISSIIGSDETILRIQHALSLLK